VDTLTPTIIEAWILVSEHNLVRDLRATCQLGQFLIDLTYFPSGGDLNTNDGPQSYPNGAVEIIVWPDCVPFVTKTGEDELTAVVLPQETRSETAAAVISKCHELAQLFLPRSDF
jgi:hypothetical protein